MNMETGHLQRAQISTIGLKDRNRQQRGFKEWGLITGVLGGAKRKGQ